MGRVHLWEVEANARRVTAGDFENTLQTFAIASSQHSVCIATRHSFIQWVDKATASVFTLTKREKMNCSFHGQRSNMPNFILILSLFINVTSIFQVIGLFPYAKPI